MILGKKYPVYQSADVNQTESRILNEATRMFAYRGFDAVSIREIAQAVGVKSSTLYTYYDGKEGILDAVLNRLQNMMRHYYARLRLANKDADTLEEVLGNMYVELCSVVDIAVYYSISIMLREKFRNDKARELYLQLFHVEGVRSIALCFEDLIRRGRSVPFDTGTLARLIVHTVLVSNDLRMYEFGDYECPLDITGTHQAFQRFFLEAARLGVPSAGGKGT